MISGILKGTVKGIMSTTPQGAVLTSILNEIGNGIFKERIDDWKDSVENRLNMLTDIQLDQIVKNQLFATVLLISAQLALKTNENKRKLLANAVINTATTDLTEERVVILLNCIEKYTIPHLRLLRFLQSPGDYSKAEYMYASPMTIYYNYYPDSDKDLDKIIVRDLYADGLINTESLNVSITWSDCISKMTTRLGDDMIHFFGIEVI